ncbi:MAG: AI-2E family transporter [Patescibacteria group bacterium]
MADQQRIEISTGTILRAIVVILSVVLLYLLKEILVIFLLAIILASGIAPFANWLESKGIPRLLGVLLLYLVVFGLAIFVLSLIVPFLSQDFAQLTAVFPKVVERVSSSIDEVQTGSRYFDFLGEIQNILDALSTYLQQFSQSAVGLVVGIFGGVLSFLAIIVISFYLSVMKKGIENLLSSVLPEKYESYAIGLWKRSEVQVGRWLQGQLLISLLVGLLVYVGLSAMGVKFALVLGILAMLLEIVPVAGPILAALPAIGLAFLQSPSLGIWVIVLYTVIQQVESHVILPLVLGKTTGLNPVVVIMALLIGAQLAGIVGAILAVPIATIIVEVIDDMARSKELRRASS